MKMPALLTLVAVLAVSSAAWCENVTVIEEPQPSAQTPTITVVYDGKPAANASLCLYRFGKGSAKGPLEKLRRKLVTNAHGQLVLPRLSWGIYKVTARAGRNWKGQILLSIAPPRSDQMSYAAFELNLISNWGNPPGLKEASAFSIKLDFYPTREQILAQEERLPFTKAASFQGRVCDISGAYIPHASIEVTRMDIPGKKHTEHLNADAQGKFAAGLPDGEYIATFSFQGFRTGVLHLVISKEASDQPLEIKLQVGGSTQ